MVKRKYNTMRKGVYDKLDREDKINYTKSLVGPYLKNSQQIQKNKQNVLSGLANSPQYKKHKKRQQVKRKGAL